MKNRWIVYLFFVIVFIAICVMSALTACNYYKYKESRKYYIEYSKLLITYNNERQIDLNSEYIDYDYDFFVANSNSTNIKYTIILKVDKNESKLYEYSIEGNPKEKNSNDILVNTKGNILGEDIILGSGIISNNQTHYYTLNIKCNKCNGNLKGSIELEIK